MVLFDLLSGHPEFKLAHDISFHPFLFSSSHMIILPDYVLNLHNLSYSYGIIKYPTKYHHSFTPENVHDINCLTIIKVLYSSMTAASEGVSGQQHAPAALYPRGRPGTHCTGGWVGPRAGRDGRKISSPTGFDPGPSSP